MAALLAIAALLLLPPHAHGNFVYWANDNQTSDRPGEDQRHRREQQLHHAVSMAVHGVAVDSKFIYWTE